MARIQWKKYRSLTVAVSLVVLYFIVKTQTYEHTAFVFLPKVHPNKPWEFVADFSNMKYLNPTIIDFNILEESGNYDHWKYTTEYMENLSHWPYLPNKAVAHFNIKASPKKDLYYINSLHSTCLFQGLYCLNAESEFKFSHNNRTKGTTCEETVKYECPRILSFFCRREVIYQRNAIMSNLLKKFS
ncbi:uncharacterized protein LOC114335027 [Diabrotica virgifera virgifera]|uniref:Glycoprotein 3-alpha-L-fucosyltransferase A-like n=1 Tax=Diabrotica virgifera virgifera TaxID=50390 RepID=A0ABM5ISY7_DIAVI|nr:uncharacterized protein LOC114335027 [Diabrotica virgifera virgifera]